MNREIKFRAWDVQNKEMGLPVSLNWYIHGADKPSNFTGNNFVEGCIFLQYTGLKDRNGKEIFEGDIIDWVHGHESNPEGYSKGVSQVAWGDDCGFEEWGTGEQVGLPLGTLDITVIGNVHENPELLPQHKEESNEK